MMEKLFKKRKFEKKGQLDMNLIIGIIILLIVAGVIFLFLRLSNPTSAINKDTCHASIVLRGTVNAGPAQSSNVVPLKCNTEKICLNNGVNNCEDVMANTKDNPVTSVKLSGQNADNYKETIKDSIANAMYDCNSMLGEGKLKFMPNGVSKGDYCFICAWIDVDNANRKNIGTIKMGDIYRYLEDKKTPDGVSYLQSIYPGWTDWKNSNELFNKLKQNSMKSEFNNGVVLESNSGLVGVNNVYYTFTNGGWYFSQDKSTWFSVNDYGNYADTSSVASKNKDFIKSLQGKDCVAGARALVIKSIGDNRQTSVKSAAVDVYRSGSSSVFNYNSQADIDNLCGELNSQQTKIISSYDDWTVDFSNPQGYVIVAQMTTDSTWKSWLAGIGVLTGTALIATGVGAPVGVSLIAGSFAGGAAFWYMHPSGSAFYSPPVIYPNNPNELQKLQCTSFEVVP